jgi:hypothetical protein
MTDYYSRPETAFRTIECPFCDRPTDSLKQYTMFHRLVFILVYAFWRLRTYTACPDCMRQIIKDNMIGPNILTGNVLWLLIMLPWGLVQLWAVGRPGHSRAVLKQLQNLKS